MSSGKQKTHLMRLRERKCHRSPLPSSPLAVPSTSACRRDEAHPPIFRRQDEDSVAAAIATAASPPRTLRRPSRPRKGGPPQLQPNQPCCMFEVCVDLYAVYENVRQDFVENFTCNDLITYVVAIERYGGPGKRGATHQLLAFLEFRTPLLVSELSEACRNIFDGLQIDVQSCHSRRDCIKTISKNDDQLLFNCQVRELCFYHQARHWAATTPHFKTIDPFVVTHRNSNFLREFHATFRMQLKTKNFCLMPFDVVFDVPWANVVVRWWNRRIVIGGHEKRHLFLRGPSNVGKTTLVKRMIGRQNMPGVLYPKTGRFAFQSFDERWHKIILFDKFVPTNYVAGRLRQLIKGEYFLNSKRRGGGEVIRFRGPIIIIASDDTPQRWMDANILSRLLIVEADMPYWVMSPGRHLQEEPTETGPGEDENVLEVVVVSSEESENDV